VISLPTFIELYVMSIEVIYLDSNHLSGTLDACIGDLKDLRFLYLFENELSGVIPIEISDLYSLGAHHSYCISDFLFTSFASFYHSHRNALTNEYASQRL